MSLCFIKALEGSLGKNAASLKDRFSLSKRSYLPLLTKLPGKSCILERKGGSLRDDAYQVASVLRCIYPLFGHTTAPFKVQKWD